MLSRVNLWNTVFGLTYEPRLPSRVQKTVSFLGIVALTVYSLHIRSIFGLRLQLWLSDRNMYDIVIAITIVKQCRTVVLS